MPLAQWQQEKLREVLKVVENQGVTNLTFVHTEPPLTKGQRETIERELKASLENWFRSWIAAPINQVLEGRRYS